MNFIQFSYTYNTSSKWEVSSRNSTKQYWQKASQMNGGIELELGAINRHE